jgi:hypothetical protein
MGGLGVGDFKILGPRPFPAAVDFVVVGGAPIMERGHDGFWVQCFPHIEEDCPRGRGVNVQLFRVIRRLFTKDSG